MQTNPIGASELIITDKGCIYHLDVHPEELAQTVITVGDPGRVATISKYFDRIEHKKEHREFVTHTGYIGQKRISVVSTGIGPDNIDITLNELDALVNVDFNTRLPKEAHTSLEIVRMGTSGALQADIAVDSLVVGTFGIGLDNLLHYYNYEENAEVAFIKDAFIKHTRLETSAIKPYMVESAIHLLNKFPKREGYIHGITVTCPGFYAPQGRQIRLSPAFPHLIDSLSSFQCGEHRISNFEMETSAIYGLGRLMGHQCLSINTIIANRQTKEFTKDGALSVERMIEKSLALLIN
ncbi:phosphorylase [Taibaiella sp. KBW10]|uniref:nucleoside phosphorylase n=1 Tax=Taibaiella sp. KBW10 TaxID=2153357 RepID=UPI000F598C16|nr:nucleoside phosphorylase [Taibaiella sp. KBW10]RQO31752.1 phosphorylase [Taibaiella sp. KBW10]